ncbi:putative ATPase [Azospira oryzae PS]|uniref:Putative ATPase n=1 Tax=Azospira oryzae (strain ATCC BAA-33 / DSM 13638 / PS) TaxID=640081 RepID=G8QIF2_AZOOP|nr:ATP-binding protein [Azospira oryzae]AEV25312.1 putative ATPase [Azospira oryzae PS]
MSAQDPTFLGLVTSVSGPTVTVSLAESLASGIALIEGHMYRVAQVGGFVRIPQGYQDLFGIVSEVGASADAKAANGGRWMRVELAGEALGLSFERGLSQLPSINDAVHIVTEADLKRIYGREGPDQISIGTLSSSESIAVKLSLDALVTRHSAVLGSTGSGKSTTVASLLRSIVHPNQAGGAPASRILLLDLHGEYTHALADFARVYSATPQPGERPLFVPYWALQSKDLLDFVAGGLTENQEIAFSDKIQEMKAEVLATKALPGLDPQSLTVDSPVPFSLKQCWYDLIDFETRTLNGPQRDQPALEQAGNAETLTPPKYTPAAMGAAGPFLNQQAKGIRRQLNLMRSRLLDHRFDFILHPGSWEPSLDGTVQHDLDKLLDDWLGHEKPVTILDLSGVPSSVLTTLVGSILKIVYEALYWSREKTEGGIHRPLLVVMEEAHRYLSGARDDGPAADVVKRIAKEGRKYGVGAMVVSQRPAEVDETILSQCGTIFALRLSNPEDRARVRGALPDNLGGLVDLLPVLRTGEAIVAGEAAKLPVRCRVTLPNPEHRPKSSDPKVSEAWANKRVAEGYDRVVASWRAQRTFAVAKEVGIVRIPVIDEVETEGGE